MDAKRIDQTAGAMRTEPIRVKIMPEKMGLRLKAKSPLATSSVGRSSMPILQAVPIWPWATTVMRVPHAMKNQPVTVTQAVLGKFAAAWMFLVVALALTAPLVITVAWLGSPDPFVILAGYLGAFLMGGAYLAVSIFCSALTRSQIVSFVLSIGMIGLLAYSDSPAVLTWLAGIVPPFMIEAMANMSFSGHFESMRRGVLEFRDLTFYGILIAGLVAITCLLVATRRESC